jgi:hypothetical protein
VREHDAMIEALAARDGARLRRILVEHLEHKRDVVLAQMKRPGGDGRKAMAPDAGQEARARPAAGGQRVAGTRARAPRSRPAARGSGPTRHA